MSKRQRHRQDSEPEFGSDSFLDVISNMVGILIILILMAAFRAKRAPVTAEELVAASSATATTETASRDSTSTRSEDSEPSKIAVPLPTEVVVAPMATDADPTDAEDEVIRTQNARIAALTAELEAEKQQLQTREAQYQRLVQRLERDVAKSSQATAAQQLEAARTQQQSAEQGLQQLRASLQQQQQSQAEVRASLEDEQQEIAALKEQLDELNQQLKLVAARERNKDKLKHKVTSLGQTVYGDEVCFRVLHGRVSVVPIEELSKLAQEKIKQSASWIVKSNRHQGEVGPIDGYVMKYEVVRAQAGLVDELNRGYGMVKLEVPRFTIEPLPTLVEESVKDALTSDGVFVRTLAQARPETTVTIWVYPDSFADYRQLAAFAQQHGFLVAGRPLPDGLPITGSSNGSRSVGQ